MTWRIDNTLSGSGHSSVKSTFPVSGTVSVSIFPYTGKEEPFEADTFGVEYSALLFSA